jgi:hypothetical protein
MKRRTINRIELVPHRPSGLHGCKNNNNNNNEERKTNPRIGSGCTVLTGSFGHMSSGRSVSAKQSTTQIFVDAKQ